MFFFAIIFAKTPKNKSKFVSCQITEFSMNTIYPQRAKGTHRAEGNIAFADRQKHRIIAFTRCPVSLPGDCHATLAMTNLLHLGNNVKGTVK